MNWLPGHFSLSSLLCSALLGGRSPAAGVPTIHCRPPPSSSSCCCCWHVGSQQLWFPTSLPAFLADTCAQAASLAGRARVHPSTGSQSLPAVHCRGGEREMPWTAQHSRHPARASSRAHQSANSGQGSEALSSWKSLKLLENFKMAEQQSTDMYSEYLLRGRHKL